MPLTEAPSAVSADQLKELAHQARSRRIAGAIPFMAGNTLGRVFTVTSFGESHGPAIGCVVDGLSPGLALTAEDIQLDLDGVNRVPPAMSRSDRNPTALEILSRVFEGTPRALPIALLIRNEDQRSRDYGNLIDTFGPGHAGLRHLLAEIRHPRPPRRGTILARETAVRVAAAASLENGCARTWHRHPQHLSQLIPSEVPFQSWDTVGTNPFFPLMTRWWKARNLHG